MTVINPNSVAGINSITVASGEALSVHKSDGTLIRTLVSSSGVSTFTSVSVGSATTDNSANNSINVGLGASISQHETNSLSLGTGGNERVSIKSDGKVGINESSPAVFGVHSSQSSESVYYRADSGSVDAIFGSSTALGYAIAGTTSNNDLTLWANNAERVRIKTSGDVGIGTNSYNAPLTVVQNDNSGHIASFRQKNAGNSAQILIDSPTDNNIRPVSIDLAQAGTIKWSLGQAYAAQSDRAFHIATSALSANDTNAKLTITTAGAIGISSVIPTSGFLLDVGGDVTIGEPKGTGNTFLDQKEDGDLHIINSGRTANGASGSPGTAGVGINRFNTRAGGTSLFRDFCVYNGKDTKVLVVDGSASAVGIGTDAPDGAVTIAHSGSSTDFLMFNKPGSVGTFARMGHNTSSGTNMLDIRSEGHTRFLTNGNNETMRLTSGNDVVIGGTSIGDSGSFGVQSSGAFRSVLAASTASDTLLGAISGVSNGLQIAIDASNNQDYKFHNGSQQTLTVTSGGKILMGGTSAYNNFENSSTNPRLQVRGTNLSDSCQAWIRATADAGAPKLFLANTRSTSEGGHTVVQASDELGQIHFAGSDGSHFINGASIAGGVRPGTTPTTDNVPGMLTFAVNHGSTATTEAVRISRGGNGGRFMLHHTDTGSYNANFSVRENSSGPYPIGAIGQSSGQGLVGFFNGSGSLIGSIGKSGDSVTFNTTSDYRLKENAVSISDGITRLKSLKPYKFNFISDSSTTLDGFFAHEVSSIVPEAVTGDKDGIITQEYIDAGKELQAHLGKPIIQSMDHSKLVPLLTAALQEAITKIETLETKVAALEGG